VFRAEFSTGMKQEKARVRVREWKEGPRLWKACIAKWRRRLTSAPYMAVLDVQVLYVERVFFDELPAGFDVFTHQRGEDGLALGDVFESHR
jgi:hypothetical protein